MCATECVRALNNHILRVHANESGNAVHEARARGAIVQVLGLGLHEGFKEEHVLTPRR